MSRKSRQECDFKQFLCHVKIKSNIGVSVLLNLFNLLRTRNKILGKPSV